MEFILNPTLQQMALIKIVSQLWNQEDIRKLIQENNFSTDCVYFDSAWQKIEQHLEPKVSQLLLPEPIKKDLMGIIKPISCQIHSWCSDLHRQCQILTLPAHFFWTPEGSIDKKKTAEMLVKDEDIDVGSRYQLACISCLEDQLPELWNRIPEQQRLDFYNTNIETNKLVEFWSHHSVAQLSKLDEVIQRLTGQSNPHVYAFYCAILEGNLVAIKFFFAKLSEEERDTLLVEYAGNVAQQHLHACKTEKCYSNVFFFMLHHVSKDQEVQLLAKCPFGVLSCFLDWPYQPSFMDLAERIMPMQTIPNYCYLHLLESMTKKIKNDFTDFDYRQLFLSFWQLSPLTHKRYMVENQKTYSLTLFDLFAEGEKAIIKALLQETNAVEREWLILQTRILNHLVQEEKWEMVEYLFEVCEPTKEVLVEVRDEFQFMRKNDKNVVRRWRILSHLLYDLIAKKSDD